MGGSILAPESHGHVLQRRSPHRNSPCLTGLARRGGTPTKRGYSDCCARSILLRRSSSRPISGRSSANCKPSAEFGQIGGDLIDGSRLYPAPGWDENPDELWGPIAQDLGALRTDTPPRAGGEKCARAREILSSWCARWGRPGCRLVDQKGQRSKRGLRAFQCRIRRWNLNAAINTTPATNTTSRSGSGTTRISASFACADSRRHGP
jgi:hypothetical protein